MRKRLHSTVALCSFLAVLAAAWTCYVSGTLAYLSARGPVKWNGFSVGHANVSIAETFRPPSSLRVGRNTYEKRVTFVNDGTVPVYARVSVALSDMDVAGLTEFSVDGGVTWHPAGDLANHLPGGWAYQGSGILGGYYYYTEPLVPGAETPALLTHVRTTFEEKTADTNETINHTPRDYDIYVYAESVQQQKLDGSGLEPSYEAAWKAFLGQK